MKVIINGAGIAGPTLAYWLQKSGHDVLLVEAAPELRRGGYIIDFWGLGYDIAEKMGLLPRIKELGYQVQEVRFVDRRGKRCGGFRTQVFDRVTNGRFTSLRRSDLAAAIYGALAGRVETIFGDSLSGLEDSGDGLRVSFDHSSPRQTDLLIGADGLHSRVRELAFGKDPKTEFSLGYHVAAFEADGYRPRDELVYITHGVPGRQVSRFSMREDKTLFLFVFHDEYLRDKTLSTVEDCKSALKEIFKGVGWECPEILTALSSAGSLYFDGVSQIRMERWSQGRTALVGDAAACVSLLAGEGTGLAMAEAYALAGELSRCGKDYASAFAGYQDRMMPFLRRKQKAAEGFASSFAPRSSFGIAVRNLVTPFLGIRLVADFFIGREMRDDVVLPDYNL
jgi:2-polyprenyl-6-methoxyphenol hydroxylase-like FAD-dependent oxidoreductase